MDCQGTRPKNNHRMEIVEESWGVNPSLKNKNKNFDQEWKN